MNLSRIYIFLWCISTAAAYSAVVIAQPTAMVAPCEVAEASYSSVDSVGSGVRLKLPSDAFGPRYESDDVSQSRPTWFGTKWNVHFVLGNGGLTEFMSEELACAIDDGEMKRRVKVGQYLRYGVVADIWRAEYPESVSSVLISIEPNGLSEKEALSIIASTVTTWESQ